MVLGAEGEPWVEQLAGFGGYPWLGPLARPINPPNPAL